MSRNIDTKRIKVATRSFYNDLILDTPEAVTNMEKAFE